LTKAKPDQTLLSPLLTQLSQDLKQDYSPNSTHSPTLLLKEFGLKLTLLKFHIINYIMMVSYPLDVNHALEKLTQANTKEKEDGGGKMLPKKNVVSMPRKIDFQS